MVARNGGLADCSRSKMLKIVSIGSVIMLFMSLLIVNPGLSAPVIVTGDSAGSWTDSFEDKTGLEQRTNVSVNQDVLLHPTEWTKQGVVVDIDGVYDTEYADNPCVLHEGGTYKMWYRGFNGTDNRILYATSNDGVTWIKYGYVLEKSKPSWDTLYVNKTEPGTNTYLNVTIKDASTNLPIPGFEDMTGDVIDISSIDPAVIPTIKLYASLVGNGSASPILHDWKVTWFDASYSSDEWTDSFEDLTNLNQRNNVSVNEDITLHATQWEKQGIAINNGIYDSIITITPCVLYDGGIYKMWYRGYNGSDSRILYATSVDGVVWNKEGIVLEEGNPGDYDDGLVNSPKVINDSGEFKMWYMGNDGSTDRILYANSTDGINWLKQGLALSDTSVAPNSVIKENGIYKMWYQQLSGSWRIYYATSLDGITWNKQGLAVDRGASGQLDDMHVAGAAVINDSGNHHDMWYSGHDGSSGYRMFWAHSNNDVSWVKQSMAIDQGSPGELDDETVSYSNVIKDNDGFYKMWYSGGEGGSIIRIFYATMPYPVWEGNVTSNTILTSSGPGVYDDNYVSSPQVINDSGEFKMWYMGNDGSTDRILYANSSDGITWAKQGLALSDTSVAPNSVIKENGIYKMWYQQLSGNHRIYYATSLDGINWDKQGLVLDKGQSGQPDDMHVAGAAVINDSGNHHDMWYSGHDGSSGYRMFWAHSLDGMNWVRQDLAIEQGSPGEFDDEGVSYSNVIKDNDGFYKMWYTGNDGSGNHRIFYATMPYPAYSGSTRSTAISLPSGYTWDTLLINKTEPGANYYINVTVLNGTSNEPILGFENLTGTNIDISSIDYLTYPTLKLYATLVGDGSSSPALHDWTVTWLDTLPPSPPTGLIASNGPAKEEITLTWDASPEPDVVGYEIHRGNSPGGPYFLVDTIGLTTTYIDSNLTQSGTYYYVIIAFDEVPNYSGYSIEVSADVHFPQAPTGLAVYNPWTGYSLTLSWNPSTDSFLSHYILYYSSDNVTFNWLFNITVDRISFVHYGVETGVTYFYKIASVDEDLYQSDFSDVVNGTPDMDYDGDGIGNIADLDDDNDGIPDATDAYPFSNVNDLKATIDDIQSQLTSMNISELLNAIEYLNQTLPGKIDDLSLQLAGVNDSLLNQLAVVENNLQNTLSNLNGTNILSYLQGMNVSLSTDIQDLLIDITDDIAGLNSSVSEQLLDLLGNITTENDALRTWLDLVLFTLDSNLAATNDTLHNQLSSLAVSVSGFYDDLQRNISGVLLNLQSHDELTGQNHSDIIGILNDLVSGGTPSMELDEIKALLENLADDVSMYNESIANDILKLVDDIVGFEGNMDTQLGRINDTIKNLEKIEDIINDLKDLDSDLQSAEDELQNSIDDKSEEEAIEERVAFLEMLVMVVIILLIVNLLVTVIMGKGRKEKGSMDLTKPMYEEPSEPSPPIRSPEPEEPMETLNSQEHEEFTSTETSSTDENRSPPRPPSSN
jgi:predicted GH43/DUF377 family glycosyl hydrolase